MQFKNVDQRILRHFSCGMFDRVAAVNRKKKMGEQDELPSAHTCGTEHGEREEKKGEEREEKKYAAHNRSTILYSLQAYYVCK